MTKVKLCYLRAISRCCAMEVPDRNQLAAVPDAVAGSVFEVGNGIAVRVIS